MQPTDLTPVQHNSPFKVAHVSPWLQHTSFMKSGFGIMWVPPSHQPPVPHVLARANKLPRSLRVSGKNRGIVTAPSIATCGHKTRESVRFGFHK